MYIPNQFRITDEAEKIDFMRRYSFATIVTIKNDIPIATQLPFFIDSCSNKLVLSSHFAMANEQTKYIENNTSLVIFAEPHAYISPVHYDKKESVPTWDYLAVHAYGKAKIVKDEGAVINLLEQMIHFYDGNYIAQWNGLSDKFKKGMIKGIVAFEMEVTDLQGQKKLSQNKSEAERQKIIEHLDRSDNSVEKEIASYIRNL
jgi:transcriptional regulator